MLLPRYGSLSPEGPYFRMPSLLLRYFRDITIFASSRAISFAILPIDYYYAFFIDFLSLLLLMPPFYDYAFDVLLLPPLFTMPPCRHYATPCPIFRCCLIFRCFLLPLILRHAAHYTYV